MTEIIVHSLLLGSAFSAAFFGLYGALNTTGQIVQRVVLLRTPAWKRFYQKKKIDTGPKDTVDQLPWETWRLVAGIFGVVALLLVLWGTEYVYGSVFGLAATYIPSFVRRQMKDNARWHLRLEVRDFVAELRLALALNVTVSQALEHIAARPQQVDTPSSNVCDITSGERFAWTDLKRCSKHSRRILNRRICANSWCW